MKLVMKKGSLWPRPRYFKIMQRIFDLLTEELGIDKDDVELSTRFYWQTEIDVLVGKGVTAAVLSNGKGKYKLALTPVTLRQLAVHLAHELVHMRQYLRGELKEKKGKTFFQGKIISSAAVRLSMSMGKPDLIPYEREPYARMRKLAKTVIRRLSAQDIAYMNKWS